MIAEWSQYVPTFVNMICIYMDVNIYIYIYRRWIFFSGALFHISFIWSPLQFHISFIYSFRSSFRCSFMYMFHAPCFTSSFRYQWEHCFRSGRRGLFQTIVSGVGPSMSERPIDCCKPSQNEWGRSGVLFLNTVGDRMCIIPAGAMEGRKRRK